MKDTPLTRLERFGQSIWIDFIRRGMISSGELARLIEEDGVSGVTSNPSIFEQAIAGSRDYDADIKSLAFQDRTADEIYDELTVRDVQMVADLLRGTYDRLKGADGFVSLEVSPLLAHDAAATAAQARRLWQAVDRPNALIKVPATQEGLSAIRDLIGDGINVNITLLFGLPRYRGVVESYIAGLEILAGKGMALDHVASVASFFLSRIDVLVDPMLEKKAESSGLDAEAASRLRGRAAIASAKAASAIFKDAFSSERFARLAAKGARVQRLLWASTGTKNPAYSDVKYVEPLIGPDTINTVPLETLNAYRRHGEPKPSLGEDLQEAMNTLSALSRLGIDLDAVTKRLEDEGVQKFVQAFERLRKTLEKRSAEARKGSVDRQAFYLGRYGQAVDKRIGGLDRDGFSERLWRKDPLAWTKDREAGGQISGSLDWLDVAEKMEENLDGISEFVSQVKTAGFTRAVLLGMGGSSLAPLVLRRIFPPAAGGLPLTVLDTTNPSTVLKVDGEGPAESTLFIVSSKSGATAEPLAFCDYFHAKVKAVKGDRAGENFLAITDPGTGLEEMAVRRGFRKMFHGYPGIGGRYSALSPFGLVPAALMGIDTAELLSLSMRMGRASASCVAAADNPGVSLGAALGELALQGRGKVTFLMPEPIAPLAMWLEQLLAESTGKQGSGLLPVAGEPAGSPSSYGDDRLFFLIRLKGGVDEALERRVVALREAGHPVIAIRMDDVLDVGQEFLRWEIAVAAAGAVLGINPFDQPNVQEAKDTTNSLLEQVRGHGGLPEKKPDAREGSVAIYGGEGGGTARDVMRGFLGRVKGGDYLAILAYLPEDSPSIGQLQSMRIAVRDRLRIATTLGLGPRYLHSTGQYHKGGPDTGLFIIVTADDAVDAAIPGRPYTFGVFTRAQAMGDMETLQKHGRRVIRVHLGSDIEGGIVILKNAVQAALEDM